MMVNADCQDKLCQCTNIPQLTSNPLIISWVHLMATLCRAWYRKDPPDALLEADLVNLNTALMITFLLQEKSIKGHNWMDAKGMKRSVQT